MVTWYTKAQSDTLLSAKLATAAAPELIRDTIGSALVAGTNVSITVDDTNDTITFAATGGGGGSASDASTTVKGIVQLAGSLGGTAAAPTVPKFEAGYGYTGTVKGAWAATTAYVVNDVVTVDNGAFVCITAHTSISQGFRYDREKWAALPIPALSGGTMTPVRALATANLGAGIATLAASPFSQRPKRFDYSASKKIVTAQATSDVTVSSGVTVQTGTQVGGSLLFTITADGSYATWPALPAPIDITNSNLRLRVALTAPGDMQLQIQVTSAVGGTDYTNSQAFLPIYQSLDGERAMWHTVGCPTSQLWGTAGSGANLSAVTGIRLGFSRYANDYTLETQGIEYIKNTASVAKCILWLDDGFATHLDAVKTATKYNLPVTIAAIAENFTNAGATMNIDQARHVQDYLRGQIAIHAYGAVDHNRAQTGVPIYEQLLNYQHFGLAAGLTGVEDMAYWSSGFQGIGSNDLDVTVKKLFRSARGGKSRLPETLPPTDPWNTRAYMTAGADTSVGTWQPYATKAINAKGLAQFVWHDMTGNLPTEFATFCAWLDANRATIQVVTPQQAFDPYCVGGGVTSSSIVDNGDGTFTY